MKLSRHVPVEHPLALPFRRAVESLTAAQVLDSARQYRGAARDFLIYLGDDHPAVGSLNQLRRDPHILGWFTHLRSLAPAVYSSRLMLARPEGKNALIRQLRPYLHEVSVAVGIPTRIVPHQLRHTYASEMVRSGVTMPALMKLLGHSDPGMTIRYVDVASNDLQREFHLARSRPRHLAPQPKAPTISPRAGLDGVVDSLLFAQHAIEMFRRSLPDGTPRRCLDRLSNRLTKILSEARKLNPPG